MAQERLAKIVCTIGPASIAEGIIEQMARAGMDVARLNFSHGTHAEHRLAIERIRSVEARIGRPIAILQDLQGPKIRLGTFAGESAVLRRGDPFVLTTETVLGTAERASISYGGFARDVKIGDRVLIDDGRLGLDVEEVGASDVKCRVVTGGTVKDHKGVNLPRTALRLPALTDKDREDLQFGLRHGVDYVGVSFVRSSADLLEVREVINEYRSDVQVVAKLERPEALGRLDEILSTTAAVMVARGDLGVEVPLEEVPIAQKEILRRARLARTPVIVATQMLESMITNQRPTRAEVSDVANAVLDGTDAVMLSAESATGAYPVEAVRMLDRIIRRTEAAFPPQTMDRPRRGEVSFPQAMSDASSFAAQELKARAIVAFTQSGYTARLISQDRPPVPIIAFTPSERVRRRLTLDWGVIPRLIKSMTSIDQMVVDIEASLLADRSVRYNDILVIVGGAPLGVRGTVNLLKLHRVGEHR
ncbi:MAG TPA: pyruvate kinase [Methylomirabilota bacterium]|jgi:pyruvate kinase|nr:pyruvate kinase [Methylomirabilota bacterium]